MPTRAEYEELRRNFRLEVPDRFNYVRDELQQRARAHPHDLALVAVEPDGRTAQRYDFATIAARVGATAAVLADLGVTAGERVFLMLPRIVQWYDVLLGCLHLGAVPMPATMQLSARDVTYRVNLADATTVVTDTAGLAAVGAALPECPGVSRRVLVGGAAAGWIDLDAAVAAAPTSPPVHDTAADDPMLIYFTSGTESYPKMVLHTHASYGIGHDVTARFWQDLRPDDLHWTVSDTGWGKAAWGKLFGQWRIGAAVLMWNVIGKPDLDRMLRIIAEQGVTTFCVPPTLYRAFRPDRSGRLRLLGSAPLHVRWRAAQPRGHQGVARGHRDRDPRRLRPDRDGQRRGEPARHPGASRVHGPPRARLRRGDHRRIRRRRARRH